MRERERYIAHLFLDDPIYNYFVNICPNVVLFFRKKNMGSEGALRDAIYQRRVRGRRGHDEFVRFLRDCSSITTDDILYGLEDLVGDARSDFSELLKRWIPNGPVDAEEGVHAVVGECMKSSSDRVVLVTLLGELGEPVSSCVHESVSEAARGRISSTRWTLRRIIRSSNNDQAIVDMVELMLDKGARDPDDIAGVYRHLDDDDYMGNRQGIYELLATNPQLWGWGHPDAPCMDVKPALRRG